MHILTLNISPNEPCQALWEGPEVAPVPDAPVGTTDWRWLQKVFVVRGDTIAKHVIDLGPASDYLRVTPFACFSGQQDSVAMVQAMAEKNRHDDFWAKRRDELIQSSTLITDIVEEAEMLVEEFHNRTSVGPYQTTQRNLVPRQFVARKGRS